MFAIGCIVYEIVIGEPPFQSPNIPEHARTLPNRIENWKNKCTAVLTRRELDLKTKNAVIGFLDGCLVLAPEKRMTVQQLLNQPFVQEMADDNRQKSMVNTNTHPIPPSK